MLRAALILTDTGALIYYNDAASVIVGEPFETFGAHEADIWPSRFSMRLRNGTPEAPGVGRALPLGAALATCRRR